MPLSRSQHFALTEMGIPLWQRRFSQQVHEHGVNAASNISLILLSVQHLIVVPRQLDNAEQALLCAILKACNIAQDNYQLILLGEKHAQSEMPAQMAYVIRFGCEHNREEEHMSASSVVKVIDCPGLTDMQKTPTLKATCWLSLKSLNLG